MSAADWGSPGMVAATHPLNMTLMLAVPLHILRLADQGGPTPEDFRTLEDRLGPILERADALLLFKGKEAKEGEVAQAFNELARGLAIMAFVPGGVPFGGEHYEGESMVLELARNFVQERAEAQEYSDDGSD